MTTATYASGLRYVDASKVEDRTVKFDHMPVYGWGHEKLGHLDGFIADPAGGTVSYAVVHAGGWLNSRRFLLPLGHIERLDTERKELVTDVAQDAIRLYPEFDKSRFLAFSNEELRDFERRMAAACCPADASVETVVWFHDTAAHYREPDWWRPGYGREETASSRRTDEAPRTEAPSTAQPSRSEYDRERVVAQSDEDRAREPGKLLNIDEGGTRKEQHLGDVPGDRDATRGRE